MCYNPAQGNQDVTYGAASPLALTPKEDRDTVLRASVADIYLTSGWAMRKKNNKKTPK